MKFKAIATLTFTLFTSTFSQAESLRCREPNTFRSTSLFINRDGAIGFNGTYIDLEASWFLSDSNFSEFASRPADAGFATEGYVLNLSPKESCTLNNNSLSEDFSCSIQQARVEVKLKKFQMLNDGGIAQFEHISKSVRVLVDVDLKSKIKMIDAKNRNIQIQATLTNTKNGKQIKLNEKMECVVE